MADLSELISLVPKIPGIINSFKYRLYASSDIEELDKRDVKLKTTSLILLSLLSIKFLIV